MGDRNSQRLGISRKVLDRGQDIIPEITLDDEVNGVISPTTIGRKLLTWLVFPGEHASSQRRKYDLTDASFLADRKHGSLDVPFEEVVKWLIRDQRP